MQADILSISVLGGLPLSVLTSLAVRNTSTVEGVQAIDDDWVVDQARALLEDIPVRAIKVGALGSLENAAAVAEVLADYPDIPVVFDLSPLAGQADPLAEDEWLDVIGDLIVPLSRVVVASGTELRRLAQDEDDEDDDAEPAECARRIIEMGAQHVLVTGLHEQAPQVVNTLYGEHGVIRADVWERLPMRYLGAGDTLSAALACLLAQDLPLSDAVYQAQDFTWHALAQGWRPGMGRSVPNRFFGRQDA